MKHINWPKESLNVWYIMSKKKSGHSDILQLFSNFYWDQLIAQQAKWLQKEVEGCTLTGKPMNWINDLIIHHFWHEDSTAQAEIDLQIDYFEMTEKKNKQRIKVQPAYLKT